MFCKENKLWELELGMDLLIKCFWVEGLLIKILMLLIVFCNNEKFIVWVVLLVGGL